jgi:hypothetical protein
MQSSNAWDFRLPMHFISSSDLPSSINVVAIPIRNEGRSGMSLYILRRHVEITLRMYKNLFFNHIGGILGVMTLANMVLKKT